MITAHTTTDRSGQPITTSHPASADRYDAAVESLLRFGDDVVDAWEATVIDDPGFAMGHIGRAYLRCLSSEGPDAAEARVILNQVGDKPRLTDRERRHLHAADAYAEGDLHGAAEQLSLQSVEYPLDALALVVGHQLDFFCGDAIGLRDRIGRSLLAWDSQEPWLGFLLGMQAFGLEECGLYAQADLRRGALPGRRPAAAPDPQDRVPVGGSHAHRHSVTRTLLEAAIRSGETALARALVSERLASKTRARSIGCNWRGFAKLRPTLLGGGTRTSRQATSGLRLSSRGGARGERAVSRARC